MLKLCSQPVFSRPAEYTGKLRGAAKRERTQRCGPRRVSVGGKDVISERMFREKFYD